MMVVLCFSLLKLFVKMVKLSISEDLKFKNIILHKWDIDDMSKPFTEFLRKKNDHNHWFHHIWSIVFISTPLMSKSLNHTIIFG